MGRGRHLGEGVAHELQGVVPGDVYGGEVDEVRQEAIRHHAPEVGSVLRVGLRKGQEPGRVRSLRIPHKLLQSVANQPRSLLSGKPLEKGSGTHMPNSPNGRVKTKELIMINYVAMKGLN